MRLRPFVWAVVPVAAVAAAAGVVWSQQAPSPFTRGPAVTQPRQGVDWIAAARGDPNRAGDRLAAAAGLDRAAVDGTRIPILLPADPGLFERSKMYTLGTHYAVRAERADAVATFTGTVSTTPVSAELAAAAAPEPPYGLVVQRTITGWSASFGRFGVLYGVDLDCDLNPEGGTCADDTVIRDLVQRSTAVVLGAAARQEAAAAGAPL